MPAVTDWVAALLSALIPGLGQLAQRRVAHSVIAFGSTVFLAGVSMALGRVSGRAVEVLLFMLLALPWWAIQSYDAFLGPSTNESPWRRTWQSIWTHGHDIRFLGLLLLISALNDTWIILKNLDYLLPFYCTKPGGVTGFMAKAISPALHVAVGYGFMRLRRWSLFVYLLYAAYGFTNGLINLTCFGPGRIRNTLLAAIVLSTAYILWRRQKLLTDQPGG
ncbi:MAG: hypothetical protein ICV75_06590 [Nitrospiraceae bacterium]|nr:hypothetical protein [Nitrospiraceae bacterium]